MPCLRDASNFFTQSSSELRKTRDTFLSECIDKVKKQLHTYSNVDKIDTFIQTQAISFTEKTCLSCGCEADPSYRITGFVVV